MGGGAGSHPSGGSNPGGEAGIPELAWHAFGAPLPALVMAGPTWVWRSGAGEAGAPPRRGASGAAPMGSWADPAAAPTPA